MKHKGSSYKDSFSVLVNYNFPMNQQYDKQNHYQYSAQNHKSDFPFTLEIDPCVLRKLWDDIFIGMPTHWSIFREKK